MGTFTRFYGYLTLSFATINTINDLSLYSRKDNPFLQNEGSLSKKEDNNKYKEYEAILLKDQNAKSTRDTKFIIVRDCFTGNLVNTATYPFCRLIGYFAAKNINAYRKRVNNLTFYSEKSLSTKEDNTEMYCLATNKKYDDVSQ